MTTSKSAKVALTLPLILLVGALLLWAVHDLEFQLDGDIIAGPATTIGGGTQAVDWGEDSGNPENPHIFKVDGDDDNENGATDDAVPVDPLPGGFLRADFARDFVPGESGPDRTTYATGSKDTLSISPGWECTRDNNVNDKTDVVNAYATFYNINGDSVLYFALERYSNEGDGNVGFWFLQDDTVDCIGPETGPGTVAFTGNHMDGDVLVVSEFSNGGDVSTIAAYRWDGDDDTGSLNPTAIAGGGGSSAECSPSNPNDILCARVNKVVIPQGDIPWRTETKQPGNTPSRELDVSEFYEAGINLSAEEINLDEQCFGTFLAVTRSSTSLTATIFDYALGHLNLCSIAVDKTGPDLSKVGDDVSYSVTITNTGAITLYKDSIIDSLVGDITDTNAAITSSDCGASLMPGASCTIQFDYTVQEEDPDPLLNTVDVTYNAKSNLTGQAVSESDDWSVNLFQPAVEIFKSVAPELSKVGDTVTYSFTINNNSSGDSPNLIIDSISDTFLDLSAAASAAGCDDLASGGSCNFDVDYTIQGGDSDPLNNTVEVHYHPDGFPNDIDASDSAAVNLFQPSVSIDKTGDLLSKVGDDVDYTITVTNTSSADSPNLTCDITDPLLGISKTGVNLAPGGQDVTNATYTVQEGDDDPLPNTASVTCTVDGYGNVLGDSDGHIVELFQPSVDVDKTGDTLGKIGDPVDYTITVTNTSSGDSPNLVNGTIVDTLLGDLLDGANPYVTSSDCSATLATSGSCTIEATRTVQEGDPDPLPNTVTVHYNPAGFLNDITDSDDHSVDLFQPSVSIDKTGDALSKVGDDVNYTITVINTSSEGSPDMDCSIIDSLLGIDKDVTLAVGAQDVTNATRTVQEGDPDPLPNTASVTCTVVGFGNVIGPETDSHSVELFQPAVQVTKGGDSLSKVGDTVTYTFRIDNNSSGDSPDLVLDSISDSVLGDLAASAPPACDQLASGAFCEFTVDYTILGTDPDPLDNTVTVHYHPAGFPNDISDSDDHSVNLFQPSVSIDKTGDPLSKIGDDVNYTITVDNTSSSDSPNLTCDISDALLAINKTGVSLAPGAQDVTNATRTVQSGDPDPLPNTASVTCTVDGFGNVIGPETDSHSVELFQPSVMVLKDGPATASVGDTVTYSFSITNNGSSDSPSLILDSVTDSLLGDLTVTAAANGCSSLAWGASCNFTFDYTIQVGDPDPLPNTVTVHYHPDGFPNDIFDDDSHSIDLVQLFEGCTPGFWKNHPEEWAVYSPGQSVASVFDEAGKPPYTNGGNNLGGVSLMDGLSFQGGSTIQGAAEILLRAAIAAILNEAHPEVDYQSPVGNIIDAVNDALFEGDRAEIIDLASQLDFANNAICELP